jgi:subtilase family serine protease
MKNSDRSGFAFMAIASFILIAGCNGFQPAAFVRPGAVRETQSSPIGWSADDLEAAYALPASRDGKGQTVFVVDAYDNPNLANDFAEYRLAMGLPSGNLTKYNQEGRQGDYPQANAEWGVEADLDVEMVSASCPNCAVAIVEANSATWGDVSKAVDEAVKLGATIVSASFTGSAGDSQKAFEAPGVTYVAAAAAGGNGIAPPAAFDTVVAVGGTVLSKATNARGYSETVWSGSDGGCVEGEAKPEWQAGSKYAKGCHGRMADDVAAVAEGVAEYDSYDQAGWFSIDGTSIGAPFCAGIFALAGNSTKQRGGRTFWVPASHHAHLFEVSGERYNAGSGWGSPDGTGAF